MIDILFSLFSGVNMVFAIMSLFLYVKDSRQKMYLFFSVFSFFSGLYFFFISAGNTLQTDLRSLVIFSAAIYYAVFPWFLFEFVGRKPPKAFLVFLSMLFLLAFLAFMIFPEDDQMSYWQIIAHVGLFGLIICAIRTAIIFEKDNKGVGFQMTLLSGLFVLLAIEEIVRYYLGLELLYYYYPGIQPLDIYPILFTIAMGIRMSKDFVKNKRMELDIIKNDLNEKKLRVLELERLKLIDQVDFKKKDLTDFGIEITRKRKYIQEVMNQLKRMKQKSEIKSSDLDEIIKFTNAQLKIGDNLNYFREKIDIVNHEFNTNLKQQYPSLTDSELHLASLLRLKLNTKEIANIKNVSPDSVKVLRYRLRKKFQLVKETNLVQFLQEF